MAKENNKIKIFAYTTMIIATILGAWAQDIAYYMNNNIIELNPIYYLTAITIISIFLFLLPQILIYNLNKRQDNEDKGLAIYLSINILLAFTISSWSLFVMIMWWG